MNISTSQSIAGINLKTAGLYEKFGYEISITINSPDLKEPAIEFLKVVKEYIESGFVIAPGETLGYGCWVTKMEINDNKELIFFEQAPKSEEYIFGISYTLRLWVEQHSLCEKHGVSYHAPYFNQMIVVSEGVLEGDPAEGVRYPSPEHMSGWWITTDRYDGDTKNLRTVHMHEVATRRPDLVKYLALPFGYRFYSPSDETWRDAKISF